MLRISEPDTAVNPAGVGTLSRFAHGGNPFDWTAGEVGFTCGIPVDTAVVVRPNASPPAIAITRIAVPIFPPVLFHHAGRRTNAAFDEATPASKASPSANAREANSHPSVGSLYPKAFGGKKRFAIKPRTHTQPIASITSVASTGKA